MLSLAERVHPEIWNMVASLAVYLNLFVSLANCRILVRRSLDQFYLEHLSPFSWDLYVDVRAKGSIQHLQHRLISPPVG
jgi:hypothetical protein